MAVRNQKSMKVSSSGLREQRAEAPAPRGPAADPGRGRHEQAGVNRDLDERALARKNAKPRSARATMSRPDVRKASTSRKNG